MGGRPSRRPRAQPAGQARGLTASDLSYLQRCHLVPLPRPAPGSWPRQRRAEVPGRKRRTTRRRPTCGRTRARHCDIARLGDAAADYSTCELFWTGTRRRPRRRAAALPRGRHIITRAAPPVGRRPSAASRRAEMAEASVPVVSPAVPASGTARVVDPPPYSPAESARACMGGRHEVRAARWARPPARGRRCARMQQTRARGWLGRCWRVSGAAAHPIGDPAPAAIRVCIEVVLTTRARPLRAHYDSVLCSCARWPN